MIDIKMDVTMGKSREVSMGVSSAPSVFRGEDGVTFTPSVDKFGVISFTNDGGLVNPPPQNIKGDMGMSEAELRESINKIIGDVNSNLEVRLNGDVNESLEVRLNGN